MIDQAIRGTSVFITLIGSRWLNLKGRDGKRRLDNPKDFVRLELESALRHGVEIIPVLVDGARMPEGKDLPAPIAALAKINAYVLSWHEGIARLGGRIAQIEREREERDAANQARLRRVDLTRGERSTPSIVTWAMEKSLRDQGHRVRLDASDLWASMKKIAGRSMDRGFLMHELGYVIDFVGVKAKRSDDRYVARSYPLTSLREVPAQLKLKRPILVGVTVYESWFRKPSSRTGFVNLTDPGFVQGATVMAIVGWDPAKKDFTLFTPWPRWGRRGRATITQADLAKSVNEGEFRSIEAVKLTEQIREKVLERETIMNQRSSKKNRSPRRSR